MSIKINTETQKEYLASNTKKNSLSWVAIATTVIAAGALLAFYFLRDDRPDEEREITELPEGSSLAPIVQDIALIIGGTLPSLASLGVAAHMARGQQDMIREKANPFLKPFRVESKLKEEADLFLKSLEETWEYVDTCPSRTPCFWPTNSQSTSIAVHEGSLRQTMDARRAQLLWGSENAVRYGNKHCNLEQMAHLDAALDLEGLEIPLPKGIASDHVVRFLEQRKPEIFERWQTLAKLYGNYEGDEPFLQTKEAKDQLKKIDLLIREAFSETTDLATIDAPIDWLQEREKAGDFLMIRSTGAEDSKKSANAGGNLSRAYVRPTPEEFMEAAGSVIASYFWEKSLQNRIDSQINPFEEPLQLAITIQRLIGEPVSGSKTAAHIPVSFVVFSNEPLYIGDEKFRVMRISASYGHGEGVVGNKGIATDTVFLLRSLSKPNRLHVLYQNQKKLRRLAPLEKDGKVSLEKVKNPKGLVNQRALNERMLAQIYRSAIVMETFYEEHPTDIEGVVQDGVVYFVQARPVNRKPMLPTFLRYTEGSVDHLQAESLVPGSASVLAIDKAQDILLTPNLEIAEQLCAQKGYRSYQLIIVGEPDPANSHSVVTFSSLGVPCLWTSDLKAVQDLLRKIDQDHLLAVCMQTSSIHLWNRNKASLEGSIEKGFGIHPAEIVVSLPVPEIASDPVHPLDELKNLLVQLRKPSSCEETFSLLEKISHFTKPLKREISRLATILKADGFALNAYQKLELLQELDIHIDKALEEVRVHFKKPQNKRLEGLFLLKSLETLLLSSSKSGVVGGYSLLQTSSIIQSIDLLIAYQEGLSGPALLGRELLAGRQAVHWETFPHWTSLLKGIEIERQKGRISKEDLSTFKTIAASLEEAGALSLWIYLMPQGKSPIEQLQTILKELPEAQLTSMRELKELQETIEEQHLSVGRFSNLETYGEAWRELTRLVSLISSKEWLEKVQIMPFTNRMIAHRIMEKALTLLDDSLKKVKAGNFGNGKERTFKKMLRVYFELMKNLAQIVPPKFISHHPDWPLVRYLNQVESILEKLDDKNPAQLLPSDQFSVKAAVLNAGTPFQRHYPQTLEDMLTLLHQNSIQWISSLDRDLLPAESFEQSLFPSTFKQMIKNMDQIPLGQITAHRTQIEISKEALIIHYNVPLRNHSGKIDLIYDIQSSQWTMKGMFLGPARDRWPQMAEFGISILEESQIFRPAKPLEFGADGLTFFWEISQETLPAALEEYRVMAEYSLKETNYVVFLDNLMNRWPASPDLISTILNRAEKALFSSRNYVTLNLYRLVFERNQGYAEALMTVEKASLDPDARVQELALELSRLLMEENSKKNS